MTTLYILAIVNFLVGTAAIYMAMIKQFPVEWLYYHYFIRKPIVWTILIGTVIWTISVTIQTEIFPLRVLLPLAIMGIAVLLSYKMHQENAFKAVDFPVMADDISTLPIKGDMQLAVIEYGGVVKAYPLDYVIHHHIINDRFGDHIVALTYCAMCHSIIPFDVTDIGPLFVGSFKNANMIVADRKTKTFFQQASFESMIGKLHPHTLSMIPFQILPWSEIIKLNSIVQVVKVTEKDFREFQLPIPGVWKKIMASEATPGLSAKDRDKSFPARTRVVGVIDSLAKPQVAYVKEELIKKGIVKNEDLGFFLVAANGIVVGFKSSLNDIPINIRLNSDNTLTDISSGTVWNIRGKVVKGEIKTDLDAIAISDEYWFSWRLFHSKSKLIRV